jgi:hypothetical protein
VSLAIVPDVGEPAAVDLHCPDGKYGTADGCGKKLGSVYFTGDASYVHPDNLVELACQDCKVRMRREGRAVARVLHRFNLAGELVETLVVEP